MIKQDPNRIQANKRTVLNAARKQFATKAAEGEYTHRLNFYKDAPKGDITLEQFEQWAIDRLRGL
jgi:DNA primase large subunit